MAKRVEQKELEGQECCPECGGASAEVVISQSSPGRFGDMEVDVVRRVGCGHMRAD